MFNTNEGYSLADIAAATNRNNDTFNGGSWWIIILLIFGLLGGGAWGGFGNNNVGRATNSGITDGYILTSDFASLERQMGEGFNGLRQQGVQIANGLSSLGYDQLAQMNNINQNINNATNDLAARLTALGSQQQSCCCETKQLLAQNFAELNYNIANQGCETRQAIANSTQAITANANANTRDILNVLQGMQTQALQDKIASLTADNQALKFAASQQAQNAYLVDALGAKVAQAAYIVPNPYTGQLYNNYCNCNS